MDEWTWSVQWGVATDIVFWAKIALMNPSLPIPIPLRIIIIIVKIWIEVGIVGACKWVEENVGWVVGWIKIHLVTKALHNASLSLLLEALACGDWG